MKISFRLIIIGLFLFLSCSELYALTSLKDYSEIEAKEHISGERVMPYTKGYESTSESGGSLKFFKKKTLGKIPEIEEINKIKDVKTKMDVESLARNITIFLSLIVIALCYRRFYREKRVS